MGSATRDSDQRLLDWLYLADQGVTQREIARRYHTTPRNVEIALYRVRKADQEAHQTPKEIVPHEHRDPHPQG